MSRVACKAALPLFFLSFGTQLSFFFFTMLLALSVFLLTRTNVELMKLQSESFCQNLHCATSSTLFCHNRATFSALLSFFLQHVGRHRSIICKIDHGKSLIEAPTCTAAKGMITRGKKVASANEGNEEYMEVFFVIKPIATPSAFSFLPDAVNLAKPSYATFFLLSAKSRKVTAPMIPSSSPLVKF